MQMPSTWTQLNGDRGRETDRSLEQRHGHPEWACSCLRASLKRKRATAGVVLATQQDDWSLIQAGDDRTKTETLTREAGRPC